MTGYVFNFAEHGLFDPNGKVAMAKAESDAHNKALEQTELAFWANKPERFVAYIVDNKGGWGKIATTWLGTKIGDVIYSRRYQGNFGRMESIRVRATNGAEYYGRKSADWAQCINLRRAK